MQLLDGVLEAIDPELKRDAPTMEEVSISHGRAYLTV